MSTPSSPNPSHHVPFSPSRLFLLGFALEPTGPVSATAGVLMTLLACSRVGNNIGSEVRSAMAISYPEDIQHFPALLSSLWLLDAFHPLFFTAA